MKAIKLRAIFTFISIFLFSFNSYSQTLSTYDSRINYFWDFYSNNRLSVINAGKGCTGIAGENEISGVLLNPASLNINKKFQLHAEYVYKTNVTWLPSSEGDNPRLKQFNPAFMISGAYRFNNYLQTGLMFYSSNSQRNDWMILYTDEFGNVIGSGDLYDNISISSISLPITFNYNNILKVGVNIMYTFYHGSSYFSSPPPNMPNIDGKSNFSKLNAQLGLIYIPIKELSIGFTFTPKVQQNIVWEFSGAINDSFQTPNVFPMKIGAGIEYRFKKIPLKIDFDYNYVNSSKQANLKDRNDFNFGAEYDYTKNLTLRAGFFTNKDYRSGNNYLDPIGKYDEYFITAGGTYKIKKFSLSLALLDSHISPGIIKQTVINGGATMDF